MELKITGCVVEVIATLARDDQPSFLKYLMGRGISRNYPEVKKN
jgi:hypothetical protein